MLGLSNEITAYQNLTGFEPHGLSATGRVPRRVPETAKPSCLEFVQTSSVVRKVLSIGIFHLLFDEMLILYTKRSLAYLVANIASTCAFIATLER